MTGRLGERRNRAKGFARTRGNRAVAAAALFLLCLLGGAIAWTPPGDATTLATPKRLPADPGATCVGRAWLVSGEVSAVGGGVRRTLRTGDSIYVGESVRASAESEAVFKTADAGIVAIRPGSEFITESFAADARNTDHLSLRLRRGALRLVSGWIGSINRDWVQIFTPEARIGIRGTDHEPYVLPEDLADATPFETGSYDKVNRGRTFLATVSGELELRAGQVGFAPPPEKNPPSPGNQPRTQRGLLTLLMPTLLERVPDFYTAGQFESDIDGYSQQADALAHALMLERQAGNGTSEPHQCTPLPTAEIDYPSVAREWMARFDAGLLNHDAQGIVDLFDRDAVIEAMVLESGGGIATTHYNRAQFAKSVGTAAALLQSYHQDRQTLDAHTETSDSSEPPRVRIKSHVVEEGRMQDREYRTESDEDYLLESRGGRWLAVRALTIQR